ncbi:unnamed protein product [Lathyrus sativus]|nr:unnamed protein product [Lathyrus sativus]
MASSSITQTSESSPPKKYDVFVSFNGDDTRDGFTDHLFGALRRKSIIAFRDNIDLKRCESIEPELFRAIEASQIFIVVFSENYASSTWCLRELEHILLHCGQLSEKRVFPVFCDVDPSHVRYQTGSYKKAFDEHEQTLSHESDKEKLRGWRKSLTEAANISGRDLRKKPQYAGIEMVAQDIIDTFGYKFSYLPNDLVGMLSPIEELKKYLLLDSLDDVRAVGICGMGGIGKTTLTSVLYGKIKVSHPFDVCCFVDDVSNIFRKYGPIGVHKQILHQIPGEEHRRIYNPYDATNLIQGRLCRLKALLVFDNVDHREQLENLAVNRKLLGAGSRIIIVCRDAHILEEYGVDELYKVPLLNRANSLQLFCRKAFKCDTLSDAYEELAGDILDYADGLPLVIKVLGSFLHGRSFSEWKSALARLRESPNEVIMDALQFSFYGLEKMELQIFLDIACFFNGREEKFVKHVLNCCGFHPDIGLRVLVDKSLISISDESKIEMHAMLGELGRKITEEARKWSRLWVHKDCYDVMLENMEKNVDAIVLNGNESDTKELMAKSLSNMSRLRLLILKDVKLLGSLNNLSNQLRYVAWNDYPFMCLPSSFQPNQLVELILVNSSVEQLWKDKKDLPNLRTLDLSYSKNLIRMLDFGHVTNLERLNLERCVNLVELDPSIGLAKKLVFLNLKNCKTLKRIPSCIYDLNSLEYLNLCSCSEAFNNPIHLELPSLASLHALCELDISFCGLSQLPADTIGGLHCLQRLNLGGNNFETLPSLTHLSKLVYLNLEHCKLLKFFPKLPSPAAIKHGEYLRAGMYIFNCPELVERQSCSSMTFSWMMQFVLANQESSASFQWIDIVIPGSDVPSLFNYQKVGKSVKINPSHIMEDNNVIGIVCCVVFSVVRHEPTTTANGQKTVLNLSFCRDDKKVHFSILLDTTLVMDQSSHMWLTRFTKESFFTILKDIDNKDGNSMRIKADIDDKGLGVEVESCRYFWYNKTHCG